METRRFGRAGHMSTVAIFGAAAFWQLDQSEADAAMEQVIAAMPIPPIGRILKNCFGNAVPGMWAP